MSRIWKLCLLVLVLLIPVAVYIATDFFYPFLGLHSDDLKDAVSLAVSISTIVAAFIVGNLHDRDRNSIVVQPRKDSFNVTLNVRTANIEKIKLKILYCMESDPEIKQIYSWSYDSE